MLETYLVRHGDYESRTGRLNQDGIAHSEAALGELVAHGLGKTTLVLSSNAPRALDTAGVIAAGLGVEVVPSKRIKAGGNEALAIKSLDDWIMRALEEANTERGSGPLVIVAHEPLLRIAAYKTLKNSPRIPYGHVQPYILGSWVNDDFREYIAQYIEQDILEDK